MAVHERTKSYPGPDRDKDRMTAPTGSASPVLAED
jgi:hypothetical protein